MATTNERTAPESTARAKPEGHKRRKPGATRRGEFFHIEVRPREEFETFRTQDVGQRRGIERVAGKRAVVDRCPRQNYLLQPGSRGACWSYAGDWQR